MRQAKIIKKSSQSLFSLNQNKMQNDKQNLTKSQLAALDLLIAHMEENQGKPLSFIGSIVDAVSSVAKAVNNVATNAVVAATNAATNAVTDTVTDAINATNNLTRAVIFAVPTMFQAITDAAPVVSALAQMAAATAAGVNDPKALQAGGNPLQGLEKNMTLENLIKIRNQYTKKQ
jgi:hypothetical protein